MASVASRRTDDSVDLFWNPFKKKKSAPPVSDPGTDEIAEPGGGQSGPVVRNFPDGTLRVLIAGRSGADPSDWSVISQSTPRAAGAPEIEYDAQGRAWTWNGTNYQSAPTFDRPDKAVGYRAPVQYAPRYPTTEINKQTGDIFTVDPYSGLPTWVGNDPRFATEMTPAQKRANELADFEAQRRFTAGENEATRRASREESDLSRALNAGQFAATLQAQRQRDEMAAEESYQNRIRQYGQDQIAGARTVAELTNSVDPAALPAFYRAGGGNIGNAIAAGASAVSDRAVLPAAQALRATREMVRPTRYTFAPLNLPQEPVRPPTYGMQPNGTFTYRGPSGPAAIGPAAGGVASAPLPDFVPDEGSVGMVDGRSPLDRPGTPEWAKVPRYAMGTMGEPATGTFMVGDDASDDPFAGGADPEMVTLEDPPGPDNARAHIMPMEQPGSAEGGGMAKFGAVLRAIGEMLTGEERQQAPTVPRYALGTGTFDPFAPILPGDEPYLREIRDIRTSAPYEELNPYSTKYRFESPTVRASFLAGRQGRFGVPVIDQQAEIERYEVPTARRGGFAFGV